MKISQIEQVKKITYSAFLIALIVVLSQLMRIQIIPRTSIPLFLIPIFVAPWLLNWYWCFFIGFMGHLLSDVSLWGVTIGSLCWNIATGIIALSLFFIYKLPWHWLKIILILIVNIVSYAPIDFILFLVWNISFISRTNNLWSINCKFYLFTNILFSKHKN